MSLIALPPVDQELPEPEGQEIDAGPFWPEQDTAQLRALAQLGGEVSEVRFREAALNAIIAVTRDLEDWRAAQVAAGYASLDAVPAQQVNGESAKIILFRRALLPPFAPIWRRSRATSTPRRPAISAPPASKTSSTISVETRAGRSAISSTARATPWS